MITAIYLDARRKVHMIMKIGIVCPVFGDDFSLGVEFPAQATVKSPAGSR
jgi:hypothetical protein